MTSASAAYSVSRMIEIAEVEKSDRYDGDGGGEMILEYLGGSLGRSLGGTGGGVLGSLHGRGDLVSRSGRWRPGNGGGGVEGSNDK